MSETDKDDATSEGTLPDAEFAEPAAEPEQLIIKRTRGASATVAWLALFLALMSVAGVGYLFFDAWRADRAAASSDDTLQELRDQLATSGNSLTEQGAATDELRSTVALTRSRIDALQQSLDDRTDLFDSLPPRMTNLERSVASLQGVSIEARNTYLIAESEYYLQIANAQLQLAGNPYLATLALEQADDRLLQMGDPALTDVRRAISDERAALEVMEKPDIAGVTLTLASLAGIVESLPLRQPDYLAADDADDAAEEQSGVGRAWGAVSGAFSGLVRHTPPSDGQAPLLTPDAEPLIRSNLSLQIQAARLALLRGEQAIFEQSIDDADAWLASYFDVSSEQVASTRSSLMEIRDGHAAVAPPDISGSLRLLRQYKSIADVQQ